MSKAIPRTILQAEAFISQNFPDTQKYAHGYCLQVWESFIYEFLEDEPYETWEIWEIDDKSKIGDKNYPLCDMGDFVHIVVKWHGLYWDARGQHKTVASIKKHYKGPNLFWFKTAEENV